MKKRYQIDREQAVRQFQKQAEEQIYIQGHRSVLGGCGVIESPAGNRSCQDL